MKKNIFDKMSDSYENFHLKGTEISMGNDTVYISPKLKLMLGWSVFILCCILAYVFVGRPFGNSGNISQEEKEALLDKKIDVDEEHDTIVPYEKDADKELNAFIEEYFQAITECNHEKLQDMVIDASVYKDNESLKKKAEFVTEYNNITVYTKEGLEEGSYIAFVVANLTIAGVNSSPYDIITLYIVNGERGYRIHNGTLSKDITDYIEKVKGDKDIQKVYKSVEKKNTELKEKDASLRDFYDIITRENIETNAAADQLTTQGDTQTATQEGTSEQSTAAEGTTTENAAAQAPAE